MGYDWGGQQKRKGFGMTQSKTTRKGSGGTRLPSVQPDKVRKAILESEQLAVANEFFASLDPDQIVVPKKKKAVAVAVAPSKAMPQSPTGEIVAELDTPSEEIWEDSLSEALGSQLQQALPTPASRPVKKNKARKRGAVPMARRARRRGIEIREREDEPFQWRDLLTKKGLKKNMGFLISLFLHVLLLLFLSLLVVQSGLGDSRLFLDAGEAPAALDEDLLNDVDMNPVVFENDNLENVETDDLLEEMMDAETEEIVDVVDSSEDSSSGGFAANRPAVGDGKSATFFGTKASGRRFVFVVDRSTSMEYGSDNFPSRELFNRYDVAKSELLGAIESLQPHQEFFVLMFAHNTMPMFGDVSIEDSGEDSFEMIAATTQNKARFQNWLGEVGMGPGTDPRNAVEIAISMQPDAIFMLSDGEFFSERRDRRPKTKDIVNRHIQQGTIVPINTVSLVVEETIATMEGIARNSGGNFRFTTIMRYVEQVANLRGPMRTRALEQIVNSNNSWKDSEKIISKQLIPMLNEYSGAERANAESLLHLATMGLFRQHVDSVFKPGGNAATQWKEIVGEIEGFYRTKQLSALGQGRELEEKLLLGMLEQKDDSFIEMFDKLEMDQVDATSMIAMVNAISRSHGKFGTSPASIGWLRELIARLKGKEPKERSQLARVDWNPEQAEAAISRLFEDRGKRARDLFKKYSDRSKGMSFRDRVGESLVKKYPESKEAGRVRQDLAQKRAKDVPVGLGSEEQEPDDPFTQ